MTMRGDDIVERIARIIDPGAWEVMDSHLERTERKWAGQDVMWDVDRFKHKPSMAKAREIVEASGHTALLREIEALREELAKERNRGA